jgi:hypothetical protein
MVGLFAVQSGAGCAVRPLLTAKKGAVGFRGAVGVSEVQLGCVCSRVLMCSRVFCVVGFFSAVQLGLILIPPQE